jgi:hypothetical protein
MRALRRDVLPRLDLRTTGMEFASEMVIRASKEKLTIAEFPIEYHPRGGESKLSSFRDGWRHLRFLLVHSPNHLFIVPGAAAGGRGHADRPLVGAGLTSSGAPGGCTRLIGGSLLMIVGTQVLAWGCARTPTAPTSWARRTPGSTACARASGSSTACCWAAPSRSSAAAWARSSSSTWIAHGFGSLADERLAVCAASDLLLLLPADRRR